MTDTPVRPQEAAVALMGDQIPCRHFQDVACFEQIAWYKGEEKVKGWRGQKRERAKGEEAPDFTASNPTRQPLMTRQRL